MTLGVLLMGQAQASNAQKYYWAPQPGPQLKAALSPIDFTFFGGSRGGGKSDCLLGRHLHGAGVHKHAWNGLILRRKYKEFGELRRRIDELIGQGLPAERIGGDQQINFLRFFNGAAVTLAAAPQLKFINDWIGHQFTEISIDECTTFPFFVKMVDKLKGSLRSPHGVPCQMFGTGNPGGSGHMEVKQFFRLGSGGVEPETVFIDEEGESRVFVPSFLHDNRILALNDPKYVKRLLSISDPILRRAWIDGDWDVFIGQAFHFVHERHTIPDIWPIPDYAPIMMTFDWGYGAPFSIGWWWIDSDNRLYRFGEWYGWNGSTNEGLRLEDSKIADGILEREHKMGVAGRITWRYSGPDCFQKKPNYQGGGQGPSTAEVFKNRGVELHPGDPSRKDKIRQFRERMVLPKSNLEMPLMVVYRSCKHFIRTVPSLAIDDDNVEDIDTEQEDHVYDEACHAVMARRIGVSSEDIEAEVRIKVVKAQRANLEPAHQKVWSELDNIREKIAELRGE